MKQKNKEKNNETEKEIEQIIEEYCGNEKDTKCGLGSCKRSSCLQFLAYPVVYLITSSTIALVQGLFFTYFNATLSSVEKDFGLTSKLSGFTTTGNDVIQLMLSIPLPFYASRGHRPRWLALGMILSALGCCVALVPHFVFMSANDYDKYLIRDNLQVSTYVNESSNEWCMNNTSNLNCQSHNEKTSSKSAHGVVALFLIAQMLAGVGSLLYYTVGYSYMDEAVAKENVPIFLSISGAMRLLGPVCGYSLASWALSLWVYPANTQNISLNHKHPRWVGAWWLGYIILGPLLMSISWVLILLPKILPATRKRKYKELKDLAENSPQDFYRHVKSLRSMKNRRWKDMLPSIRRLSSNAVYRLVVLKQVLFWFAFFGYITFKSKYLEHQFRLSASEANRYIAGVSFLAALIGWLGTGATLSFFKPRAKAVIIYMAILTAISALCHFVQATIHCDHPDIEGLDKVIQYSQYSQAPNSDVMACETSCGCFQAKFSPVCSNVSSTTFFSSCFAECSYTNQSQIKEEVLQRNEFEKGYCPPDCPSFMFYLSVSVVAKMAHAASRVPVNILLLRCSEERDKDMGLGIFNAMTALGSSIPAPIIFGWAIDSACILWDQFCSERNSCWLYNVSSFRIVVHGVPAVVLLLCLMTDLLLLKHQDELELFSESKVKEEKKSAPNATKEEEEACL